MRQTLKLWSPWTTDRFFEDFLEPAKAREEQKFQFNPPVDIEETDSNFEITVDLPGLKKEDIQVEFDDDRLTVSGERKTLKREEGKSSHWVERFQGAFSRTFTLPKNVKPEAIQADYKEGILRLNLPKVEAAKKRVIQISA